MPVAQTLNRSLSELAVEHIHRKLMAGDLPPGSRLSDVALSQEIGISRTPVREAINQLASGGLVEQIPGVGAFVKIPDDQEVLELLQVREYMESIAISLAAESIEEEQLAELRTICRNALAMIREARSNKSDRSMPKYLDRSAEFDLQFHAVLLRCAKNRFVRKIMGDLHLMNRIFAHKHEHPAENGLRTLVRTWREHQQLLKALEKHDQAAAADLMVQHIRNYPLVNYGKIRYRANPETAESGSQQAVPRLTPVQMAFLRRRTDPGAK